MAKKFKQIIKESFDLLEGRMSQLAVDMDELDDRAFKAKHKRSKQEMSTALNKPMKQPNVEMDEEVEQIDEISQGKLMKYRAAASDPKYGKDKKKTMNRLKGYSLAGRKVNPGLSKSMGNAPRVAATEEVEVEESKKYQKPTAAEIKKDRDREEGKGDRMYGAMRGGLKKPTSGKWKSVSYKTADGRWASKDVKEEVELQEGQFDYSDMAKHLVKRYGNKITNKHIDSLQNDLDTNQSIDREELHAHIKKHGGAMKEGTDYLETDLKKRKKNNDKAIKDMKKMGSPMRNPAFGEEVELEEGSYKEGETRMGGVGPITTDAQRRERARKYRERLKGNQHKIDANDDGKISSDDFKILRNKNKARYK